MRQKGVRDQHFQKAVEEQANCLIAAEHCLITA